MNYYNRININAESFWLAGYTISCFFVSFLLSHPQLLVGVVVNAVLVFAALNYNEKSINLLAPITAPSIGVVSKGALFSTLTSFLFYMIPFIWVGNAILVFCMRMLNINMYLRIIVSAFLKSLFLFSSAFVLVKFGIIPSGLLFAMGIMQFLTAISGGLIAIAAFKIYSRLSQENGLSN